MSSPQRQSPSAYRPTTKALLYTALVLALLAAAAALRSFRPVALTIPAVLMMGFSGLFTSRASVRVERRVERSRASAGETLRVELRVSSSKPCLVEVLDRSSAPVVDNPPLFLLHLRESESLEYEVRLPQRGVYSIGPAVVRLTDALGLWEEELEVGGRSEVVALPKLLNVKGLALAARYTGVWPGEVPSRRSGRGYEFYGVRKYVTGDELRRVNWRATARLGELMVNERVEERVTDVLIVVDAGLLGLLGGEEAAVLVDAEASLAASLAFVLLRAGNRVGLVARGRGSLWVRPGFGRRQLDRILYVLSALEPGEPAPLDYALSMLTPYLLRPNAELVAITPLLDSCVAASLLDLASRYSVLVISPNPLAGKHTAAYRMLEVERANLVIKLSNACRVVDWAPSSPSLRTARRSWTRRWV